MKPTHRQHKKRLRYHLKHPERKLKTKKMKNEKGRKKN